MEFVRKPRVRMFQRDDAREHEKLLHMAVIVKETLGVVNNAAWYCCLDALGVMREMPRWNRRGAGRTTPKWAFGRAVKAFREYEAELVWGGKNRFFSVEDMPPETRRLYKEDMSNREYYDFWVSMGGAAYTRSRAFVTSLQNKYRLSLVHGGMDPEEAVFASWGLCALSCLDLAVVSYRGNIRLGAEEYRLLPQMLAACFGKFSLEKVFLLWKEAVEAAFPGILSSEVPKSDERNIELGKSQLAAAWLERGNILSDMRRSLEDCGEDVIKSEESASNVMRQIDSFLEEGGEGQTTTRR